MAIPVDRPTCEGALLVPALLLLALLPASACGPRCSDGVVSCLRLRVEGRGAVDALAVTLRHDSPEPYGQSELRRIVAGPQSLPTTVAIPLPDAVSLDLLRSLTVMARRDGTSEVWSGSTTLSLPPEGGPVQTASLSSLQRFESRTLPPQPSFNGLPAAAQQARWAGYNSDVALGDLNRDGRLDVVIAHVENQLSIWLQQADGSFLDQPQQTPYVTTQVAGASALPNRVAIVDVDGNGLDDVVAGAQRRGDLSVLPGQGDGRVGSEQPLSAFASGAMTTIETGTFIAADLDGKAPLDFVVVPRTPGSSQVAMVLNKTLPGQSATAMTTLAELGVGRDGVGLPAAARLDADAYPDVLLPHIRSAFSHVDILWGSGTAGSFPGPVQSIAAGNEPNSVAVADFNHDHCNDFAVVADESRSLHVFLQGCGAGGAGSRSFGESRFAFGMPRFGPKALIQADA